MNRRQVVATALLSLSTLISQPATALAQNTVVTYQGRVQSGGSDFSGAGQFKFALVTVTNTAATATTSATISGGFVTLYTVTSGGNGYVTAPAVTVSGGGGSGATATATISGGVVTQVNPANPGSGYTSTPTVTIAPPPENLSYTSYWSNDGTSSAGSEPAAPVDVAVSSGLFTARLGDTALANMAALGPGLFTQPDLRLRLWFNDGVNGFAVLHPSQPLTAAPYALAAGSANNLLSSLPASQLSGAVGSANVSGTYGNTVTFNNAANSFSGSGADLTALNANNLSNGTVPDARLAANLARTNQVWLLSGNVGTTAGPQFVGTTDNQPLEFKVNNQRGLRLEYVTNSFQKSVNVIGGWTHNFVGPDVVGATIGGGGADGFYPFHPEFFSLTNGAEANFATIGGGIGNTIQPYSGGATIGGGEENEIQPYSEAATIGGGIDSTIQTNAHYATIGGGYINTIQPYSSGATIGGGCGNTIQTNTYAATIGGGHWNTIQTNADYATIPGGTYCSATKFAFAAGRQAKANHQGAFVWGDSTEGDFGSTAANQFLIRADRVGIGTNAPLAKLDVEQHDAGVAAFQAKHVSSGNYGLVGGSWYSFYAFGPGTHYAEASSIRWKDNVRPIPEPLAKIEQLRGVYFDWDTEHGGHHDVGMIAEEVGVVLPEIVAYETNGVDARGMDYSKLGPLLVEAVKALKERAEEQQGQLERKLQEQENRIANLERDINRLQALLRISQQHANGGAR